MAGAKCLLKTPSNFQSSAMFEGSESGEVEGGSTESTVVSSISACKRVLCSNSVLDSCEYWLKNEKTLCRLGLLDEDADTSCTLVSCILRGKKHAHRFGNTAGPCHVYLSLSCGRYACGPK
ncbi:hypothetical protein ILYODFUR_007699 [Ilyodon furcidens]|uniref:Uncharacterized protein n=2 Tax=Goodeidae TaxID=28758 RepID=A0ABV0U5B7_9TELE